MIRKIVFASIYVAMILTFSLIPFLGYITIGVVAISIIPFFVVVATVHLGFLGASTSSITFGLGSLFAALVQGDPYFIFPDLSVLPRILVGLVVYLVYKLLRDPNWWKVLILGIIAPISNTIFVTIALYIHHSFAPISWLGNINVWLVAIWLNVVVEIIACAVISTALWPAVYHLRKKEEDEKKAQIYW
ncbi:ECF transporter S component [Mycoplasma crocodyli]|uniref:Putative membrane protein n=1 Tax=Mycoplasma crocodyli (strain ATCC 51981 / MP145) TaxID=512564 RepID=D5E4L8_MYCCM|nr:ECF transporter S component [Mycoplasma crocodyli]ADE19626.1 putative membrane protein [Mycoplasma crocodyli MP145]